MDKKATTRLPINELSAYRWSPRAFLERPVENNKLISIFEAARWSASGGNEQPWRFILGIRPDETWENLFRCLDEGNQEWNSRVPVLILSVANMISTWSGKTSPFYQYDTGQAVAQLSLEAMNQGLHVHQMGGFSSEKARELFSIPDDYAPMTIISLGYIGDPVSLSEKLKAREIAERKRKELTALIFSGSFGNIATLSDL